MEDLKKLKLEIEDKYEENLFSNYDLEKLNDYNRILELIIIDVIGNIYIELYDKPVFKYNHINDLSLINEFSKFINNFFIDPKYIAINKLSIDNLFKIKVINKKIKNSFSKDFFELDLSKKSYIKYTILKNQLNKNIIETNYFFMLVNNLKKIKTLFYNNNYFSFKSNIYANELEFIKENLDLIEYAISFYQMINQVINTHHIYLLMEYLEFLITEIDIENINNVEFYKFYLIETILRIIRLPLFNI